MWNKRGLERNRAKRDRKSHGGRENRNHEKMLIHKPAGRVLRTGLSATAIWRNT